MTAKYIAHKKNALPGSRSNEANAAKRADADDDQAQQHELKNRHSFGKRFGAAPFVGDKPVDAPEQREHQATDERSQCQRHALVGFQLGIAKEGITGPGDRRTQDDGGERFQPDFRRADAANDQGDQDRHEHEGRRRR